MIATIIIITLLLAACAVSGYMVGKNKNIVHVGEIVATKLNINEGDIISLSGDNMLSLKTFSDDLLMVLEERGYKEIDILGVCGLNSMIICGTEKKEN